MVIGQKVTIANSHHDQQNRNQLGTIKRLSAFPEVLVVTENSPNGTWVQTKDISEYTQ